MGKPLFTAAEADAVASAVSQFFEDCDSENSQGLRAPLNRVWKKIRDNSPPAVRNAWGQRIRPTPKEKGRLPSEPTA